MYFHLYKTSFHLYKPVFSFLYIKTLTEISYCQIQYKIHRSAIYRGKMACRRCKCGCAYKKKSICTNDGNRILSILSFLSFRKNVTGYSIVQKVEELTNGEIRLSFRNHVRR